jgi:hypothetical protein
MMGFFEEFSMAGYPQLYPQLFHICKSAGQLIDG